MRHQPQFDEFRPFAPSGQAFLSYGLPVDVANAVDLRFLRLQGRLSVFFTESDAAEIGVFHWPIRRGSARIPRVEPKGNQVVFDGSSIGPCDTIVALPPRLKVEERVQQRRGSHPKGVSLRVEAMEHDTWVDADGWIRLARATARDGWLRTRRIQLSAQGVFRFGGTSRARMWSVEPQARVGMEDHGTIEIAGEAAFAADTSVSRQSTLQVAGPLDQIAVLNDHWSHFDSGNWNERRQHIGSATRRVFQFSDRTMPPPPGF